MSDPLAVDLSGDPQVQVEIEKMQTLVEHASASHVVRAAIRYFSESSAEYEREVYIREQLEFDQQRPPSSSETLAEAQVSDPAAGYTEAEWRTIAQAVILAPFNMTVNVGKPGVAKTVRESAALANGANKLSKTKYKHNALIQALLAGRDLQKSISHENPTYDETLTRVKEAGEAVDRVSGGHEAREYKQFLVDLTQHVAEAAGEGFMGTGEKVSQAEVDYISTLRSTLGLE